MAEIGDLFKNKTFWTTDENEKLVEYRREQPKRSVTPSQNSESHLLDTSVLSEAPITSENNQTHPEPERPIINLEDMRKKLRDTH